MTRSTPIVTAVVFAALAITGIAFIVAGGATLTEVLPLIGAGMFGGALAYFLVEVSAWDRARSGRR